MQTDNRPLSPHLQIYRWQWTMALSILHRGTGMVLSLGAIYLFYWLVALASGPEAFGTAQAIAGSVIGQIVLFGVTFSVFYHLCNGIRHLFWDMGKGFELKTAQASAYTVVAVAVALTILSWILAYSMGGA